MALHSGPPLKNGGRASPARSWGAQTSFRKRPLTAIFGPSEIIQQKQSVALCTAYNGVTGRPAHDERQGERKTVACAGLPSLTELQSATIPRSIRAVQARSLRSIAIIGAIAIVGATAPATSPSAREMRRHAQRRRGPTR